VADAPQRLSQVLRPAMLLYVLALSASSYLLRPPPSFHIFEYFLHSIQLSLFLRYSPALPAKLLRAFSAYPTTFLTFLGLAVSPRRSPPSSLALALSSLSFPHSVQSSCTTSLFSRYPIVLRFYLRNTANRPTYLAHITFQEARRRRLAPTLIDAATAVLASIRSPYSACPSSNERSLLPEPVVVDTAPPDSDPPILLLRTLARPSFLHSVRYKQDTRNGIYRREETFVEGTLLHRDYRSGGRCSTQ
jgi:hypothetical protein